MNRFKRCRYGDMVYPAGDTGVGRGLDLYGEFSEGEVQLFRRLIQPGHTVIDIGANIGAHTVPLAQLVGPQGLVHAFEPQRTIYYLLCANVVLNNLMHVICHQARVGAVAGQIVVPEVDYDAEINFGGIEIGRESPAGSYQVPLVRIDDLQLARCDFIKIDVEGMEQRVLEGAVQTISTFRPFLYLEDDRLFQSDELHAFIESLGYEWYMHNPALYNPANVAGNPNNIFGLLVSRNLLCRHRESPVPFDPQYLYIGDQDPSVPRVDTFYVG